MSHPDSNRFSSQTVPDNPMASRGNWGQLLKLLPSRFQEWPPWLYLTRRSATQRLALAEADMPVFFAKLDAYEGDPFTKTALELLIFTSVRPGELRRARWKDIEVSRSLWRLPAARMKMEPNNRCLCPPAHSPS